MLCLFELVWTCVCVYWLLAQLSLWLWILFVVYVCLIQNPLIKFPVWYPVTRSCFCSSAARSTTMTLVQMHSPQVKRCQVRFKSNFYSTVSTKDIAQIIHTGLFKMSTLSKLPEFPERDRPTGSIKVSSYEFIIHKASKETAIDTIGPKEDHNHT